MYLRIPTRVEERTFYFPLLNAHEMHITTVKVHNTTEKHSSKDLPHPEPIHYCFIP